MILPSGPHLIQMLNVVVLSNYDALRGGIDWPGGDDGTIDDPSTAGRPDVWGTRTSGTDSTGAPVSGRSLGHRAPGDPEGGAPKRRRGGSGHQPNKNVLTRAEGTPGPRACFAGSIRVEVTKPPPDTFGQTGQRPTFTTLVGSCKPYNPPTIARPATALSLGDPNLITQVEEYLSAHVGSDSFAVVIEDSIGGPGLTCTADADCAGFSAADYSGTGVGTVIHAG